MNNDINVIEETGKRYNEIIFGEDYIPKNVYAHQIRLRDDIIDRCIFNKKFKNSLDFGCGTGFHLNTLRKYSENLIAIDLSIGALKEAKKKFNCEYIACDIKRLPFKEDSFDFIWIAGVLHHMPNDLDKVIYKISSILRMDGLILIDEPNRLNPFNTVNMKISKADPTGKERPLSLRKIESLLLINNFLLLESDVYELFSPIGILFKSSFILNLCGLLDKFINRTLLKPFLLRWYIFAVHIKKS